MSFRKAIVFGAMASLLFGTAAYAEDIDVMRYQLKAPILFSGEGSSDPDDGGGPPDGNPNGNALAISLPAEARDWATVGDDPGATLGGLQITGGTPSYVLSNPDALLPPGLNIQGLGFGGLYSTAGRNDFVLRATDSLGAQVDREFSVLVEDGLTIANYGQSVYQATTGVPFSLPAPTVAGGRTPYEFLPLANGMTVDPVTGTVSYTPSVAGLGPLMRLDVEDARDRAAHTNQIQVNVSDPLVAGYGAASYSFRAGVAGAIPAPTVVGGRSPTGVPGGTSPAGMTAASNGGASGTPNAAGSGTISYAVTDADGRSSVATAAWTVSPDLVISGVQSSYAATTGVPFSAAAPSVANNSGTVTWSVSGSLPAGLSVNASDGVISGTPTVEGTASALRLQVSDSIGSKLSSPFDIVVAAGESVATISASTSNVVLPGGYFTPQQWSSNGTKRLVVPSGVTLHATTTASGAITIGSGRGGSLVIENHGDIYGFSGTGGAPGANGNNGGPALSSSQNGVTVENYGTIKSGAGGGAGGAAGGPGGTQVANLNNYTYSEASGQQKRCYYYSGAANPYSIIINSVVWSSQTAWTDPVIVGSTAYYCDKSVDRDPSSATGYAVRWGDVVASQTPGGVGGSGGNGQTVALAAQPGTAGVAGSNGSGTGSPGGAGGAFGVDGSNSANGAAGSTGAGAAGKSGGLRGFLFDNAPYFTLVNHGGTTAGR